MRFKFHNEILAFRSIGISIFDLLIPFFKLGIIIVFISFISNDILLPLGSIGRLKIFNEIKEEVPHLVLKPYSSKQYGDLIFVSGEKSENGYKNVTFFDNTKLKGFDRIFMAKNLDIRKENFQLYFILNEVLSLYCAVCTKSYYCYYFTQFDFNYCRSNSLFEIIKKMKIDKLFVKSIILTFLSMNLIFMILIILGDLFVNLLNFLEKNISLKDIFYIYYLYLPKAFSDGVALSFLFAISNLIGNLSMRNEIIGLFSCGVPLTRILRPIILISVFISVVLFFFDNYLVIDTVAKRDLLIKNSIGNNGSIDKTIIIRDLAREIYNIKSYDIDENAFSNLMIIIKDSKDEFQTRYDINKAEWKDNKWKLYGIREFVKVGRKIKENAYDVLDGTGIIKLEPDYIRTVMLSSKALNFTKLINWISFLKSEHLNYSDALFDLLNRIFFSFRLMLLSFTVGFIALALKKNIFILSLLNSIAFAVVYVISIVIFSFLADLGYLNIYVASSFTTIFFLIINFLVYRIVRK